MTSSMLRSNEELMKVEPDPQRLIETYNLSKTDRCTAIKSYEGLAAKGSVLAQLYAGYVYRGLGDSEKANLWFERAYQEGSVDATLFLGIAKAKSNDLKEAERYFLLCSEAGDPTSKWRLANIMIGQANAKNNMTEIVRLLKSSASAGCIHAENRLAFLYMEGSCGIRRVPIGFFLFLSSLCKGFFEALRDPGSRRLW